MKHIFLLISLMTIFLKLISQTTCICDLTIKDSIYYNNGTIYNGKFNELYKNGNIRQEGFIKNGKLDSTITSYDRNGKLIDIARFKDNHMTNRTLYIKTAFVNKIITLKDNLEDGLCVEYYSNGQPKDSGYYSLGSPIGKWTYWDKTGKKTLEIESKKDYIEHKIYNYSKDSLYISYEYYDLKGKKLKK